jgi:hypothetical protein
METHHHTFFAFSMVEFFYLMGLPGMIGRLAPHLGGRQTLQLGIEGLDEFFRTRKRPVGDVRN